MVYLNNAATTFPKPPDVLNALLGALTVPPAPGNRSADPESGENPREHFRARIARFFGARRPQSISFSSGATESLNMVLSSLAEADRSVVMTVTEHNSVLRPLERLRRERAVRLVQVTCDARGYVDPGEVARSISRTTACVVVNHGSNVTGAVQDLVTLSKICREREVPLVVDASQTAGHVPIDVESPPVDVLVFAGHKGLYGVPGVGGAYIRPGLLLRPLVVGGTGSRSDVTDHPPDPPVRYEAGTPNVPGAAALATGTDFAARQMADPGARQQLERHLQTLIDGFSTIPGVRIYCGSESARTPVVSFTIRGFDAAEIAMILSESWQVIIRPGLHCAPQIHHALGTYPSGTVRVSPSWFTTEEEVRTVLTAVDRIACAKGRTQ